MVQAFVISRLDYCNALCYGITDELTRLNAAARLVTGTRRCDHISPVLRQLHWLPVWQRIVFKIATSSCVVKRWFWLYFSNLCQAV